jgi:hypothetical protein
MLEIKRVRIKMLQLFDTILIVLHLFEAILSL